MESWGAKARTMQAELELLVLGLCTASAISCSDAPSCSRWFEIASSRQYVTTSISSTATYLSTARVEVAADF